MFIGRKDELKQLESIYASAHSNLIVLYGRDGIGKTSLVLKFCEDKSSIYYKAVECTEKEQLERFNSVLEGEEFKVLPGNGKRIIVIDEFRLLLGASLNEKIIELYSDEESYGKVMIVLISSSVNWVENSMVRDSKELARRITGLIKLKELSFAEMVDWFPKAQIEDCIIIRALLGGVPKYLTLWQENRRVKENIISLFFSQGSSFIREPEYLLKLELRELNAYNTILTALASGKYKLNDIYAYTGFSRAKISVYLKNLIQMDIVEKIFSYNVRKSENTQKGLYRIKDNFINFYYAYVFPNVSDIELGKGRNVYENKYVPDSERYMRQHFSDVCKEYLELMSRYGKLKNKYTDWRSWFGKTGTLDVVASDADKNILVAVCCYDNKKTDEDFISELKEILESAGLRPAEIYIFSKSGFTSALAARAKADGIVTVEMSDL